MQRAEERTDDDDDDDKWKMTRSFSAQCSYHYIFCVWIWIAAPTYWTQCQDKWTPRWISKVAHRPSFVSFPQMWYCWTNSINPVTIDCPLRCYRCHYADYYCWSWPFVRPMLATMHCRRLCTFWIINVRVVEHLRKIWASCSSRTSQSIKQTGSGRSLHRRACSNIHAKCKHKIEFNIFILFCYAHQTLDPIIISVCD